MRSFLVSLLALLVLTTVTSAQAPTAADLAKATIDAAGGEEKLPKLFRIKENLILGENPQGKPSSRTTVIEPPAHWWQGKRDRVVAEKEPAIFLVWTWTLGSLADPKSKLKTVDDQTIDGRATYGLEVSGTITPPLTAYFDKDSKTLVRIDWRKDQHKFSDWKESEGYKYPAKCVGYKSTGKPWYFTEILEFERLKELPAGLTR